MQVHTTRFGNIEADEASIITFTQPIPGFQEFRRFILLPGPEEGGLKWLQSTESAELAFILMDPTVVVPEYTVDVRSHDLAELSAKTLDDLDMYTFVVVPEDRTQIRTNLRAPVLLNPTKRLAKQIILDKSDYPIQYFLAKTSQTTEANEEISHARTDPPGR